MEKDFENILDSFFTPADSDIGPTIKFTHFPFKGRSRHVSKVVIDPISECLVLSISEMFG